MTISQEESLLCRGLMLKRASTTCSPNSTRACRPCDDDRDLSTESIRQTGRRVSRNPLFKTSRSRRASQFYILTWEKLRDLLVKHHKAYLKKHDGVRLNSTTLHLAALEAQKEIVELLIANGGDVNAMDDFGLTPLHEAAGRGHKEIVKLLIQEQADVHAKNNIVACRPILGRQPLCGALRPPQAPAVSLSQRLCPHRLPAHFVP